jgi:phage baseplate assembly protein W
MSTAFSFTETTLAFPFKISSNGTVATINNQEAIWATKVKSVIGTLQKERVMFPAFGSRLGEAFWNTETFAKEQVRNFIQEAFIGWLPTLTLQDVQVSDIDESGQLTISISYLLPNNSASNIAIGVVGISGTLQLTQESR